MGLTRVFGPGQDSLAFGGQLSEFPSKLVTEDEAVPVVVDEDEAVVGHLDAGSFQNSCK